jgi:hypothetical protein
MEFQAYPSKTVMGSKAAGYKVAALKLQGALHNGESLLLPVALLLAAAGAVLWEHVSKNEYEASSRNFIALIVVTMVPLAFLEKGILACSDPLSIMSKFSGKVLLSHACFLALRVLQAYYAHPLVSMGFLSCFVSFVAACILCTTVYRMRSLRAVFLENVDVWCVILLGLAAAVITEGSTFFYNPMTWSRYSYERLMFSMVATSAMYVEILAFVPAVMLVCRARGGLQFESEVEQRSYAADTRLRAFALLVFLVGFYFHEDFITAIEMRSQPAVAMAHVAHFLLLMDFAGFLLSHLYDPAKFEKLVGTLRDMFVETCAV